MHCNRTPRVILFRLIVFFPQSLHTSTRLPAVHGTICMWFDSTMWVRQTVGRHPSSPSCAPIILHTWAPRWRLAWWRCGTCACVDMSPPARGQQEQICTLCHRRRTLRMCTLHSASERVFNHIKKVHRGVTCRVRIIGSNFCDFLPTTTTMTTFAGNHKTGRVGSV